MKSSRLSAMSTLIATDPQIPIAEDLAVDLIDVVRRRVAKHAPTFSGSGAAYAMAVFVADWLVEFAPRREQLDAWMAIMREEWEARLAAKDLMIGTPPQAPTEGRLCLNCGSNRAELTRHPDGTETVGCVDCPPAQVAS